MRFLYGIAIIALLSASVSTAQSLADVARGERARRQAVAEADVVYTTEDLRSLYGIPELSEAFAEEFAEAEIVAEIRRIQEALNAPGLEAADRTLLETELAEAEGVLAQTQARTEAESPEVIEASDAEISTDAPVVAPFGNSQEDRIESQTALAEQEALVQSLEDQIVSKALAIGQFRARLTAPTGSQRLRNQAQAELESASVERDVLQAALDAARAQLERLRAASQPEP